MGSDGSRTLGDYFTLQRGTTYKSRLLDSPGPVLLGLATIQRNGGFRTDSLRTYGGDSPAKLLVHPGELYLSLKDVTQSADLLGAVARLPVDHAPGRLTQDTVKLEPKGRDVPLDYLYWLLRTPQYRSYCRAHATGTTNLGLARDDFLAFPAPEPSPAQCKSVETLAAIEDEIELNRRMSQTLESMARALFKSWFVDFDPVRAKSEGRDPGLPSQVADLFPDSFDESEIGEIPNGWRVATMGSIADVVDCSHAKKPERGASGRPLLQLDNIRQDGVLDMSDLYLIGECDYQAWTVRIEASPGDCVITNVGRVGAVAQVPSDVRAALGRNMTAVRCRSDKPWPTFLVEALRSDSMRDEIVQKTDAGTILDALNVRSIPRLRVVEASGPVLSRFEAVARPLRAKMETIEHESRGLQGLRDAMLPSLLAGDHVDQIG
jgi:type I restriction enzyme, S subunit